MADQDKKNQRRLALHSVDSDDFIRFLAEKAGDDDPCMVCDDDNWMIYCPDGGSTFRFGIPVRNAEKIFYASMFMYYCMNCGFIRQHSSKVVSEWVKHNPADVDIDDQQVLDLEDQSDV